MSLNLVLLALLCLINRRHEANLSEGNKNCIACAAEDEKGRDGGVDMQIFLPPPPFRFACPAHLLRVLVVSHLHAPYNI